MSETARKRFEKPFRMIIQDAFNDGHGVMVTGYIATGAVEKGDAVFISGGDVPIPTTVIRVEMFGPEEAAWGDNVGLLLHSIEINYIKPGMIVTKQDE